jgi:hypothetical protein
MRLESDLWSWKMNELRISMGVNKELMLVIGKMCRVLAQVAVHLERVIFPRQI